MVTNAYRRAMEKVQDCERDEEELFQRIPTDGDELPNALFEMALLKERTAGALRVAASYAISARSL